MLRDDKPVTGQPLSYADGFQIVQHPAFRLGFLDAARGQPLDHDHIMDRIFAETPPRALERLGWSGIDLVARDVALAQYRYEEGRAAVVEHGCRCKAWGHPDYPPAQVRALVLRRVDEIKAERA